MKILVSVCGEFVLLVAALLFNVGDVEPSKILGYLVSPGRSHFIIHDSLLRGLAEKGHNVTVVGIFPPRKPMPATYRYIQLGLTAEDSRIIDGSKSSLLSNAEKNTRDLLGIPRMMSGFQRLMAGFMQRPEVEQLKREETFDLLVFGYFLNDHQLGLAGHFRCPSVVISATPALKGLRDLVGNPSGAAYAQFAMISNGKRTMTFSDRVFNYIALTLEALAFTLAEHLVFQPRYEALFPPDKYPSLDEVRKNVSLVMVNGHVSVAPAPAAMPGMLEISGIQIKTKPDPLPADIKEWLDGAKDGAIFFSFGSNIDSSFMSDERRNHILAALSKLKQRVLWKYDKDDLPNKPDNLMIGKWLPQDDILTHPNVRLFISHCGKGSINEAKYHGVPILGIPMFGDQIVNARNIVNEGWAVSLEFSNVTEETLTISLREVLNNSTYRDVVKTAADLYKDRPQHPLDLAVFWTEYVLRHNGAKHLQSQAVHMNWFQLQSYDVLAVIFLALYVVWKVLKFGFCFVIGLCFKRSKKAKAE